MNCHSNPEREQYVHVERAKDTVKRGSLQVKHAPIRAQLYEFAGEWSLVPLTNRHNSSPTSLVRPPRSWFCTFFPASIHVVGAINSPHECGEHLFDEEDPDSTNAPSNISGIL
jgi:hypothetical protein